MPPWVRWCPFALAIALFGCTAPGEPSPASPPSPAPPASATSTVSPSRSPGAAEQRRPRPLRIAFAGDIHFEGVLADRLRDPVSALAPAAPALTAADLAVVNLETSIGAGGDPEPGKRYTFSAGRKALAALSEAGVDVASMANNHALDFGRARLPSTLRAVRAAGRGEPPLAVIGIGRDAEAAFLPALTAIGPTLVATLAASQADLDPTADPTGHWAATATRSGIADATDPSLLLDAVRRADETADMVVVYLHWGVQGARCPSTDQRGVATRLVRAGADVVVGSHAHQLQGDGRLGEGYVAYGLGNFAWYSPGTDQTSRTGVLTLTVRPPAVHPGRASVVRASWEPRRIGADGLPSPVTGAAAADFRAEQRDPRECAGLDG
jgi:poly-gamma-glutamate capsule biosynthesis protein CapA/YwtB (metallophosphatase superfamily)